MNPKGPGYFTARRGTIHHHYSVVLGSPPLEDEDGTDLWGGVGGVNAEIGTFQAPFAARVTNGALLVMYLKGAPWSLGGGGRHGRPATCREEAKNLFFALLGVCAPGHVKLDPGVFSPPT